MIHKQDDTNNVDINEVRKILETIVKSGVDFTRHRETAAWLAAALYIAIVGGLSHFISSLNYPLNPWLVAITIFTTWFMALAFGVLH